MYTSSTSQIYTKYDINCPPPHPGSAWTRFVCISDNHSEAFKVPPGDVLLHSGDLSSWGYVNQLEKTVKWLASLPHPVKVIIAGNHDLCLDPAWIQGGEMHRKIGGDLTLEETADELVRDQAARAAGIHYLEYESLRFTTSSGRTWEIYGSPAAPKYAHGAFQYIADTAKAVEIHVQIPSTTEILLTHTPPYGICDTTRKGIHAGCAALAARLHSSSLSRCRLHVFGHIHEAHGALVDEEHKRVSVNAAMYFNSPPVIVDLLN